jgi:hypothetical protein
MPESTPGKKLYLRFFNEKPPQEGLPKEQLPYSGKRYTLLLKSRTYVEIITLNYNAVNFFKKPGFPIKSNQLLMKKYFF